MNKIEITCRLCKKAIKINARLEDIKRWQNNEGYIQDLLGYLTADERELLISQTCGQCFDKLFPPESV